MTEKYGISTKKLMLQELKEKIRSHPSFVLTNYKGHSSLELEELRRGLREMSSKYFVVKNSIAKRAFNELELKDLNQFLNGEVGISFIGDLFGGSKVLVDFLKKHPSFRLDSAIIDGKLENVDRIKQLAMLPPKEVLLGLALNYMKSPIVKFTGLLNGLLRNLVYVINEIKSKKEAGEK